MPNKTCYAKAKCPYFKGDSRMSVACEPYIKLATRANRTEFTSEDSRRGHEEKYCFTFGYNRCPYAKLLTERYLEEEKQ